MISLKGMVRTYSGTIEFHDLSETAYSVLDKVVKMLNAGEDPTKALGSIQEAKPAPVSESKAFPKKAPEKPAETPKAPPKKGFYRNMQGSVDKETVYEIVKEIVETARANPDQFEFRPCKAGEFVGAYSDLLNGCGLIAIGSAMERLGFRSRVVYQDGYSRHLRDYPMPVNNPPKTDGGEDSKNDKVKGKRTSSQASKRTWKVDSSVDSYAKNWNKAQAEILRNARLDAELSISEFAELIGYPFYAIQRWESASSSPSSEAMEALKKVLGNKFCSSIEAAAGSLTAVGA